MTGYYRGIYMIFQDECQTCNIDQINETLKFNVNYLINCNLLAGPITKTYFSHIIKS